MGIVNHDELAIQRLVHVQFDHADAESHGRCKRSGSVFQDVCGSAAMSDDNGHHAVFWRSKQAAEEPAGLAIRGRLDFDDVEVGTQIEVFGLNLGIVVRNDLLGSPIVVVQDFETHLPESGCQQAGTGELTAGSVRQCHAWEELALQKADS